MDIFFVNSFYLKEMNTMQNYLSEVTVPPEINKLTQSETFMLKGHESTPNTIEYKIEKIEKFLNNFHLFIFFFNYYEYCLNYCF